MKRILAFICVMACLCGLCLPAMAAPEGMVTITAEVPADWTNVHLYAWLDDATNMAAWPGTPMNKTDDGRYTLDIPLGEYPNIIVNNGEGGAQTQDMSFDGISDAWVIVSGGYGEVLYYDPGVGASSQGGSGEAAALNSMALVGEGVDALKWEPDNADCEMTKVEEGVWSKDLTLYKGTTIKFKACGNDAWDAGYNLGGNADGIVAVSGTAIELMNGNDSKDISFTASQDCTLTVTVDMNGDVPTLTVTETAATLEPAPEVNYIKVYVSLPEGITPNLWAWGDAGNAFPSWPGQAMTKDGDWWVVDVPDNCNGAIVNDGTSQTADLSINLGADSWIVVGADWTAQVSASEPALTPGDTTTPDESTTTPTPTEPTEPATTAPSETEEKADEDTTEAKGGVDVFMIITFVMAGLAVAAVVVTVIIIKKKG